MSYGFIYFAINPSMPGITKIGMTTKHPALRLGELSGATGCPEPFELIAFWDTENPGQVETAIHRDLEPFRVNDRREFFDVPYAELEWQIDNRFDKSRTMGVCSDKLLRVLAYEELMGV